MKMYESLINFKDQSHFDPMLSNDEKINLDAFSHFVIMGMGGSHLPQLYLSQMFDDLSITPHNNERIIQDCYRENTLNIAISYSGNTEEALMFANSIFHKGLPLLIISKGGKLLEFAQKNKLPFLKIPESSMQPRMALGILLISLCFILDKSKINQIKKIIENQDNTKISLQAKNMSTSLQDKLPIIYSNHNFSALAYSAKLFFNETTKIPAFCNYFSELNHNEMESYAVTSLFGDFFDRFIFIIIRDTHEPEYTQKRIDATKNIYRESKFHIEEIEMDALSVPEKFISTFLLIAHISLELGNYYKNDVDSVPTIEHFKTLIN